MPGVQTPPTTRSLDSTARTGIRTVQFRPRALTVATEVTAHKRRTTTVTDDNDTTDDLSLEDRIEIVEAWKDRSAGKRFADLEDRLDQLEEDNQNLREENEALREELEALRGELDVLDGLADDEKSTPQKRAADLRRALRRRAKDRDQGKLAIHYKAAWDILRDLGHEGLHAPQIYAAMEDAAEADGFQEREVSKDGKQVRGIAVNLDELPFNAPVNEINNEKETVTAGSTGKTHHTNDT